MKQLPQGSPKYGMLPSAGRRAQGTEHRAQGTGHRAQGTGHRVKDLEMKGPQDCKTARPQDNVSCIIGDV